MSADDHKVDGPAVETNLGLQTVPDDNPIQPIALPDGRPQPGGTIQLPTPPPSDGTPAAYPVPDAHLTPAWNPSSNLSDLAATSPATWGRAEPRHGDVFDAAPVSSSPTRATGAAPDARYNLLDAIKTKPKPNPPAPVEHIHYLHNEEHSPDLVRGRVVRVASGTTPTVILDQNPLRVRALCKVITTGFGVTLGPIKEGGHGAVLSTFPSGNLTGFPLACGDPLHEVKSGAGVSAVGWANAAWTEGSSFCDVAIWEELHGPGSVPGLT